MKLLRHLSAVVLCCLPLASWADGALLVTEGPSEVDITTAFAGTELKIAGAITVPGELIIKLAGPPQVATLSRAVALGPFWVEGAKVKASGAPSVLFLHASAPIASILPFAEQERYGLLLERVVLQIEPQQMPLESEAWRSAYFRLKQRSGHYRVQDDSIKLNPDRSFAASLRLPGDLQTGTYGVETLLVQSGKVVGRHFAYFNVRLAGVEHWMWHAAHDYPWSFGLLFTLAAILLGIALNAFAHRTH